MRNNPLFFASIVMLGTALLLDSCAVKNSGDSGIAPDFMLSDLAGNRFYLNQERGSVILLNFWSIHCLPCLKEMPVLDSLARSFAGHQVLFAGICNDPGESGYAASLLKDLDVQYLNLLDPDKKTSSLYGVSGLPVTVIIDRKGLVRYRSTGYDEGYCGNYASVIEQLLHEKTDARSAGKAD